MVARDPIRKVTLDPHTEFDGKKDGADRYGSPHVGSTTRIPEPEWPEEGQTTSGTSSYEVAQEDGKKSKKKGS